MRRVFTGFRFSPFLIWFGPCVVNAAFAGTGSGWETVRYSAYFPLLWRSPFVSFGSAINIYATCAVLIVQGIGGALPSAGGGGQVQRASPPDASAASIAAITRSVMAPLLARNAFT